MSLKNWSTTADSNTSAPPDGAPEGMTIANVNNTMRKIMADVRTLAAADTIAAAAGATDLGAKDATILTTTGTAVTITGWGSTATAGIYKFVIYNAAHTLTYNATSMILLGNASRTVAAGDVSLFVSEGSGNWRELFYSPDAGYQPLDADLTAIAALTTTATGLSLLEIASAAAGRAILSAQETLVSGTNIKTVNSTSLLGSGDIAITDKVKAWINFDGTSASIGTGRANYNVASVTDNGTGDYTINFSTALADANYVVAGMATSNGSFGSSDVIIYSAADSGGGTDPTASSFRIRVISGNATTPLDLSFVNLVVFR